MNRSENDSRTTEVESLADIDKLLNKPTQMVVAIECVTNVAQMPNVACGYGTGANINIDIAVIIGLSLQALLHESIRRELSSMEAEFGINRVHMDSLPSVGTGPAMRVVVGQEFLDV